MNKRKRVAIHKHRIREKKLEEKRRATRPAVASGRATGATTRPRATESERPAVPGRATPTRRPTAPTPATRTRSTTSGQTSEARPSSTTRPSAPRRTAAPRRSPEEEPKAAEKPAGEE